MSENQGASKTPTLAARSLNTSNSWLLTSFPDLLPKKLPYALLPKGTPRLFREVFPPLEHGAPATLRPVREKARRCVFLVVSSEPLGYSGCNRKVVFLREMNNKQKYINTNQFTIINLRTSAMPLSFGTYNSMGTLWRFVGHSTCHIDHCYCIHFGQVPFCGD